MTIPCRETPTKVEFRWRQHEVPFAQRLAESANEAARSPGEQARELLKDALGSDDRLQHALQALRDEIAQLYEQLRKVTAINDALRVIHENIYRLRDEQATCAAKILVDAGRLDPKGAIEWLRKTLDAQ
jgi:DNA repair exonuclease SbcCD ATPase subunit